MAHHKIEWLGRSTVHIDGDEYVFYESESLYSLMPTIVVTQCFHSHNYGMNAAGDRYNCLLKASKLINKWLDRQWTIK